MFSINTTRYLAIGTPLLMALMNFVPSDIFLSMATILGFFAFYISTQGQTPYHEWLRKTAVAAATCAVLAVPVVLFDAFFFNDNLETSGTARILHSLSTVTPYFSFFISIAYGLFAAVKIGFLPLPLKSQKQ